MQWEFYTILRQFYFVSLSLFSHFFSADAVATVAAVTLTSAAAANLAGGGAAALLV